MGYLWSSSSDWEPIFEMLIDDVSSLQEDGILLDSFHQATNAFFESLWKRQNFLEGYKDIFTRQWWSRAWIIQEVATAKDISVHIGKLPTIPLDQLLQHIEKYMDENCQSANWHLSKGTSDMYPLWKFLHIHAIMVEVGPNVRELRFDPAK